MLPLLPSALVKRTHSFCCDDSSLVTAMAGGITFRTKVLLNPLMSSLDFGGQGSKAAVSTIFHKGVYPQKSV